MAKANVVKTASSAVNEVADEVQENQQNEKTGISFAREHEIARQLVKAGAFMKLKDAVFCDDLSEHLINMRAAQIVKSKASLALKFERKELQQLLDEYKHARTQDERDAVYEKIKAKNNDIEKHLAVMRQADDEFLKNLNQANKRFDQEHDMIDSKINALPFPPPFKFLLGLFYHTEHFLKIAAFHLSTIKVRNTQYEKAFINEVAEAYKNKNIEKMKQLAEKSLSDDTKVREATQGNESIFDDVSRDELVKALQALKDAHGKLEQALQGRFNTLVEAERLINNKKQELSEQSQNQEPPSPSPSQAV